MLVRMQGKGNLHSLWDCKLVQPLSKSLWRMLTKVEIYHMSQYTISWHVPKRLDILLHRYLFSHVWLTLVRKWKHPKCSSLDAWVIKMWHICTIEYYSDVKKKLQVFQINRQNLFFLNHSRRANLFLPPCPHMQKMVTCWREYRRVDQLFIYLVSSTCAYRKAMFLSLLWWYGSFSVG